MSFTNKRSALLFFLATIFCSCHLQPDPALQEFNKIDSSLEEVAKKQTDKNSLSILFSEITSKKKMNRELVATVEKLYYSAQSTKEYIEGLKKKLIASVDSTVNTDIVTKLMIDSKEGNVLKEKLKVFYSNCTSIAVDPSKKDEREKSMSFAKELITDDSQWKKYFDKVPVVAGIALLTQLQADVMKATAITLEDINAHLRN